MQRRFRCYREGLQSCVAESGPLYRVMKVKQRKMRSRSLGSIRCVVRRSNDAVGRDEVTGSQLLQWRHGRWTYDTLVSAKSRRINGCSTRGL
ncbi:hypothetical protein NDU88_006477 [Pleurodeles waltl]|uniref:Uncharacterized protein n=1 Tax=Pleurodeles waltl TaxID=8319 RepID=A0AAV7WDS0_PLEWA|nr:hypothetical protein NDU88_006477 [Pleurodeles waltl]